MELRNRVLAGAAIAMILVGCGGSAGTTSAGTGSTVPGASSTTLGGAGTTTGDAGSGTLGASGLTEGVPAPCSMVTDDQATQIAGNPVTGTEYFGTDCVYDPEGVPGVDGVQLQVAVYAVGSDGCGELLDLTGQVPGEQISAIDGLGDLAQWAENEMGGLGQMEVCQGDVYASVQVNAPSATSPEDLRRMARQMIDLILPQI